MSVLDARSLWNGNLYPFATAAGSVSTGTDTAVQRSFTLGVPEMTRDFTYIPVRKDLISPELGYYSSFGMEVLEEGTLSLKVSDISTNESLVTVLAQRCTAGQLEPSHLFNVIEDMLGE